MQEQLTAAKRNDALRMSNKESNRFTRECLQTALIYLTGPDIFEAPAREEGTVSVFAMDAECTGVFERGLKWELDDAVLTNRTTWGLSNELMGEAVMIGVESGTLVIFYPL